MAKNKQLSLMTKILRFVATALGSGFVIFLVGWLMVAGQNVKLISNYMDVLYLVGLAGFIGLGAMIRKGKELLDAQTISNILFITAFFLLLNKLPFAIPYITFVVTKDVLSMFLVLGAIWFSEGIVKKFIK